MQQNIRSVHEQPVKDGWRIFSLIFEINSESALQKKHKFCIGEEWRERNKMDSHESREKLHEILTSYFVDWAIAQFLFVKLREIFKLFVKSFVVVRFIQCFRLFRCLLQKLNLNTWTYLSSTQLIDGIDGFRLQHSSYHVQWMFSYVFWVMSSDFTYRKNVYVSPE